MQSKAQDVPTYLDGVKTRDRECLERLRRLCVSTLKGYEEGMDYGMPCYKRDGVPEIAFASQANYISLYVLKTDVVKANRAALRGLNVGKGCIRFPSPEKIDFKVVEKLLADTRRSSNRICK
ncbi:MAG TPA: DUF1801 domain-containing protein [Thermoanaerobaculia bacterium]|nr:DUF1801 domain-containing protein [Thermoanaerobaculia bacterium]